MRGAGTGPAASESGQRLRKGDTMTNHIHDIPQVVGKPAGYVNDATGTQHVVYRGDPTST
jgi:hypothetical protein